MLVCVVVLFVVVVVFVVVLCCGAVCCVMLCCAVLVGLSRFVDSFLVVSGRLERSMLAIFGRPGGSRGGPGWS